MLFDVPQLGQFVWMSAFDTKPQSIDQILRDTAEKFPGVSVQFVDLDKVPGRRYLFLATINALKSYNSNQPIAKSLGMEILLYISGNGQINEALKRVGVTSGTRRTAALAVGGSSRQVSDAGAFLVQALGQGNQDELLDDWPPERVEKVRSVFEIGDKEVKAVIRKSELVTSAIERLAIERSALVAVRK